MAGRCMDSPRQNASALKNLSMKQAGPLRLIFIFVITARLASLVSESYPERSPQSDQVHSASLLSCGQRSR